MVEPIGIGQRKTWAALQEKMMQDAAARRQIQSLAAAIGRPSEFVTEPEPSIGVPFDMGVAARTSFRAGQSALDRQARKEEAEASRELRRELQEKGFKFREKMSRAAARRRGRGRGPTWKRYDRWQAEFRKLDPNKPGADNRYASLLSMALTFPKVQRELALSALAERKAAIKPAGRKSTGTTPKERYLQNQANAKSRALLALQKEQGAKLRLTDRDRAARLAAEQDAQKANEAYRGYVEALSQPAAAAPSVGAGARGRRVPVRADILRDQPIGAVFQFDGVPYSHNGTTMGPVK